LSGSGYSKKVFGLLQHAHPETTEGLNTRITTKRIARMQFDILLLNWVTR